MRRATWLALWLLTFGCTQDVPVDLDPCEAAVGVCPECYDGEVTCTLDGYEGTAGSCGNCQAIATLARVMCDAGETEMVGDATCSVPTRP
jgi:hypothetical protein